MEIVKITSYKGIGHQVLFDIKNAPLTSPQIAIFFDIKQKQADRFLLFFSQRGLIKKIKDPRLDSIYYMITIKGYLYLAFHPN